MFIDKDGFTSIVFDLCLRVGPAGSGPEIDGKALTTHLEDVVGDDINTVKVWNTTETQFSKLEYGLSHDRLANLHPILTPCLGRKTSPHTP